MTALSKNKTASLTGLSSFEIKSTQFSLIALIFKSDDLSQVASDFFSQFGPESECPDFFDKDQLVLDFSILKHEKNFEDVIALAEVLKKCNLSTIAFKGEPSAWTSKLEKIGLIKIPAEVPKKTTQEINSDSQISVDVKEISAVKTMLIEKPLRSGQKIYARGADLVILAMVNQGAEVIADGNIHVYAPLRGRAMAGARGNTNARIFSLCMEPELVSIAGIYRTSENPLPTNITGRPAQIRLSDDGLEKLLFEPLKT